MRKSKGSITVFALLSLLLVTATLFALLEGTRYQEIRRFAHLQTDIALESAFSNYNQDLWKQYRLLGMNGNEAEQILLKVAKAKDTGSGVNLLRFDVESGGISSKTLLTDGKGGVFVECVSTYMQDNILYETAKEVYNQYESIQELVNTSGIDLDKIDDAVKELENLENEKVNSRSVARALFQSDILEKAQMWKEDVSLGLFVKDTKKLSDVRVNLKNDLFHRRINVGDASYKSDTDWLDRILLQQYLLTYLSNYETNIEGHALVYEAEYLLGKNASDKENLLAVISRILAIREAANFIYLLSDPVKVQQAHTLAVTLGGVTLNPLILELINIALLTAWAMGESILDVRGLLEGKRIPLIKSDSTWTLELENIALVSEEFITAKESKMGLSYKDYLGILLLFENELNLAMRTMNLQEITIRKISGDDSFSMDSLIVEAEAEINYGYRPVFPFLSVIDAEDRWIYQVRTKRKYGYHEKAV